MSTLAYAQTTSCPGACVLRSLEHYLLLRPVSHFKHPVTFGSSEAMHAKEEQYSIYYIRNFKLLKGIFGIEHP